MRTIAFVTQKGGAGKSTLAASLAVAAQDMKETVCVVDMDPQGSLTNWARTRGCDDVTVVASGAARLPGTLAGLAAKGFTLAIIDTPGAEGPASSAAMATADLNIIPARPSLFDLWASANTRAALKAIGADFVFLLNQCPPAQQSARVRDGAEALEELGALITPLIAGAGRLPGGGAPRLWRHRTQSQWRRGRGDARALDLDPSPSRPRPPEIRRAFALRNPTNPREPPPIARLPWQDASHQSALPFFSRRGAYGSSRRPAGS